MATPTESFVLNHAVPIIYTDTLIKPKGFKGSDGATGKPQYGCTALIPPSHPQLAAIQALILKAVTEKWPGRDPNTVKLPMKHGDKLNAERVARAKKPIDFYAGVYVLGVGKPEQDIKGTILAPPSLSVMQGGQWKNYSDQREIAKPFFYNGVEALMELQFVAYDLQGGLVKCYLRRAASFNIGTPIPIGRSDDEVWGSADSYSEYVGRVTAETVMPPQAGAASPW